GGGFAAPGGHGILPGADPQLWSWFQSVDMDRSGSITAEALQRALLNGDWTPFDLDTVKLLMTLFDMDRTITFAEFAGLWVSSTTLTATAPVPVLAQFGFNLSPQLLVLVERKYGEFAFDLFVRSSSPCSSALPLRAEQFPLASSCFPSVD
ncbi:hypothetical protein K438DRAFT_1633109, partial [Mycena galopus ATCC 62051]